jgi:hypothetical protein
VNDLQQLFGIEIGQLAIEEQELAFRALQLSQRIGSAQRFGRGDARLQQILHDLLANSGIGAGYDNGRIGGVGGFSQGRHKDVVMREP